MPQTVAQRGKCAEQVVHLTHRESKIDGKGGSSWEIPCSLAAVQSIPALSSPSYKALAGSKHFKKSLPLPSPKKAQFFFLCGHWPVTQEALIVITRSESPISHLVELFWTRATGICSGRKHKVSTVLKNQQPGRFVDFLPRRKINVRYFSSLASTWGTDIPEKPRVTKKLMHQPHKSLETRQGRQGYPEYSLLNCFQTEVSKNQTGRYLCNFFFTSQYLTTTPLLREDSMNKIGKDAWKKWGLPLPI